MTIDELRRLDNIAMIVLAIQATPLKIDRIVTMPESTFFYFFGDGCYADIECENDGTILAGCSGRANPEIWIVTPTTDAVLKTLERIRKFLL